MSESESGDKNPRESWNPEKKDFLTPRVKHDRWVTPPPEWWGDEFGGGHNTEAPQSGQEEPSGQAPAASGALQADSAQYQRRDPFQTPGGAELEAPPQKLAFLSIRKILRDVVFPLLVAFMVAMFAQATVAKPYQIPSGSMLPTIQLQDRILANRLVYRLHSVERGDVIVFMPPASIDPETPYVKRVIGLPGDRVEVSHGKTYVNGEEFAVPTASSPTYTRAAETVPDGMLFVLGDNRNESSDSHIWGYVPMDNVIGRADIVYWPPKNLHLLGN
ncbi:MAG: signal peptidase I [Actinobacteria bacterium]|nr:signal peptidase I [Actinomycetota bacterium]